MKLFPNFTSIPSDYLLISQVTNYVCNRGFFTCLSCFYRIDREHHALKSLELKFGLSLEFSEFFDKIPVSSIRDVLFRVFRFSKASFTCPDISDVRKVFMTIL